MTTKIQWVRNADGTKGKTWNPMTGCTHASPGCDHCYAERMAKRFGSFDVTLHRDRLSQPLHWKKPRTIFVCSMGDLFHEKVPVEFIAAVWAVMSMCPQHTFQVLTKRPERARKLLTWELWPEAMIAALGMVNDDAAQLVSFMGKGRPVKRRGPLPNVWFGVTAEDQQRADERIPVLLGIPAAIRFVSIEPMLGPVDLERQFALIDRNGEPYAPRCDPGGASSLGWVIAGTESGPGRRPASLDWFRSLRDQCRAAWVPFFLKQAEVDKALVKMPELDGVVWDQMPEVQ